MSHGGRRGSTYRLANGVDARDVTTTGNLDADIDIGELVNAQEEDGLVQLGAEDIGAEKLEGSAVDLDHATSGNAPGHSYHRIPSVICPSSSRIAGDCARMETNWSPIR